MRVIKRVPEIEVLVILGTVLLPEMEY